MRLDANQRYDLILEDAEGSKVAIDLNACYFIGCYRYSMVIKAKGSSGTLDKSEISSFKITY